MNTTTKTTALKINTGVKAGGLSTANHNLTAKTGVKAGGLSSANHNLVLR